MGEKRDDISKIDRIEGEDYDKYAMRLYNNKALYGLDKDEIADILNKEFPDRSKGESAHRKDIASYTRGYNRGYDEGYECGLSKNTKTSTFKKNLLVPKSHLENLKEWVTEYDIKKRDMQLTRNELARKMRVATASILMTEEYRSYLDDNGIDISLFKYDKVENNGSAIIKSLPSDWHIGAEVNEEYNEYNYKIACYRMEKYTQSIIDYARIFNATTVSITGMGDYIEGFDMRNPQKWDCELTSVQQVELAKKLLIKHIMTLQDADLNVEVSGVAGNHDRVTGNKRDSVEENNFAYTIFQQIKDMFEFAEIVSGKKNERVKFVQKDDSYKYHVEEIYGNKIRYQHGDDDSKNDERKIEKYNGADNSQYDVLVFGHLHHFRDIQRNRNTREIYCSCLQGSNHYSKYNIKSVADAGQTIIVFRDNGEVLPININLQ